MEGHFATFITDDDLAALKAANLDVVRIPVFYNTFLPEDKRNDTFPRGEGKALDMYDFTLPTCLTVVLLSVFWITT